MRKALLLSISTVILSIVTHIADPGRTHAAPLQTPMLSPFASVSQTVGVAEMTVRYSRPSARGRTVFGDVVPYGEMWRTGANAATTIEFTMPVKIGSVEVPAGKYVILTIPTQNSWTIVLNSNLGIYITRGYNESEDLVRAQVPVQQSEFNETFRISFENMTPNSTDLTFHWERSKVALKIEVQSVNQAIASFREQLNWRDPMNAARWCLLNQVNLEEAMRWIDLSIIIEENYWNLRVKAQLLMGIGQLMRAIDHMNAALAYAAEMAEAPFDLEAMRTMLAEWKQKFIET